MSPDELVMHLKPPPGIQARPYPPWRDQVYRVSLTVMAGALLLHAAASFGDVGLLGAGSVGLLAAATLSAAYFFLVWIERFRWLVLALSVAGVAALLVSAALGVGLLLAASSVMAAKETHCFHFVTGRVIPWVSLAAALAGFVPGLGDLYAAGLGVVGLLWVPLLWSRFRMRLLSVSVP
jgi:hypothetical protein